MTDTTPTLNAALAAAQSEFPPIAKGKTAKIRTKSGVEYSYSYADLADILRVILPILGRHGLSVVQPLKRNTAGKLCVTTKLMHGEAFIESDGLIVPEGLEPQELGSVLTYWRRYDLCSLLAIAPDEDTDGNVSTKAKAQAAIPKPAKVEKAPPKKPPMAPDPAEDTMVRLNCFVNEVVSDKDKRGREFRWITLTPEGLDMEKVICYDPKLFAELDSIAAGDADLELSRNATWRYPRVTQIFTTKSIAK
jgi:hypothetical protein